MWKTHHNASAIEGHIFITIFTARQRSCAQVMFSAMSVSQSVGEVPIWPLPMMQLVTSPHGDLPSPSPGSSSPSLTIQGRLRKHVQTFSTWDLTTQGHPPPPTFSNFFTTRPRLLASWRLVFD